MTRPRICILTTAHLSNNPRVIKEADALSRGAFDVVVVACQFMADLVESDREIIERAAWSARLVSWDRETHPVLYWFSGVRHYLGRRLLQLLDGLGLRPFGGWLELRALERVLPELLSVALDTRADFYIGHNPAALTVVARAAAALNAMCGFDAEDYFPGISPPGAWMSPVQRALVQSEHDHLESMNYLSAASPLIAEAYETSHGVAFDTVVLNAVTPVESPPRPHEASRGTVMLYWVSQVIGADRGLEEVIESMAELADLPVELHLRGAWQAGYEHSLRSLAHSLAIPRDRVVHVERVPYSELVNQSARFHIGLAVERSSSVNREICITNKILLYLGAGLAVAATATRGQRMVMTRIPKAGFLYPSGDSRALAGGLRAWIEDPVALQTAREAAYEAARSTFTLAAEQGKLLDTVSRIMSTQSCPIEQSTTHVTHP